jgi:hypothetical protein
LPLMISLAAVCPNSNPVENSSPRDLVAHPQQGGKQLLDY